jgi:hypothetical protein
MLVYSLLGSTIHEGDTLLGVFGSLADLTQFVQAQRALLGYCESRQYARPDTLGYDSLGYIASSLGAAIDIHAVTQSL